MNSLVSAPTASGCVWSMGDSGMMPEMTEKKTGPYPPSPQPRGWPQDIPLP